MIVVDKEFVMSNAYCPRNVCGGQISVEGYLAGNSTCGVDLDVSKVVRLMKDGESKSFRCPKCEEVFKVICYYPSREMSKDDLLDLNCGFGTTSLFPAV